MHRFDSDELKKDLEALPLAARVAFALACAERVAAFTRGTNELAQAGRTMAHRFLQGLAPDIEEIASLAARMEASPDIDVDDVAACFYLIECLRDHDPQGAIWTAERAYEARDQAAQSDIDWTIYTPAVESALLAHPAVQAELAAQAADIGDLLKDPACAPRIARRAAGGGF